MNTTSPINSVSPFAKALQNYSSSRAISDLKQVEKGNGMKYISFKDNNDPYTLRTVDKFDKVGNPVLTKSYLADGGTATLFPDGRLVQRSAAGKTSIFNMA